MRKHFYDTFHKQMELIGVEGLIFSTIRKTVKQNLNNFSQRKTKYLRANHFKFVSKELNTSIILRLKLRDQSVKKITRLENFI